MHKHCGEDIKPGTRVHIGAKFLSFAGANCTSGTHFTTWHYQATGRARWNWWMDTDRNFIANWKLVLRAGIIGRGNPSHWMSAVRWWCKSTVTCLRTMMRLCYSLFSCNCDLLRSHSFSERFGQYNSIDSMPVVFRLAAWTQSTTLMGIGGPSPPRSIPTRSPAMAPIPQLRIECPRCRLFVLAGVGLTSLWSFSGSQMVLLERLSVAFIAGSIYSCLLHWVSKLTAQTRSCVSGTRGNDSGVQHSGVLSG